MRSLARVAGVALVAIAALSACKTPQQTRPIDVADRLFVRGDHEAAAVSYAAAADIATDSNEELRARFFALLSRRAASEPAQFDRMLGELRSFSNEASSSPWGRLAGFYADEMSRTDAMQRAVQRAGADLAAQEVRIAELERTLLASGQEVSDLNAAAEAMRDERQQLQRSVRELEELLQLRAAALVSLEAELEALKRIDMSRTP